MPSLVVSNINWTRICPKGIELSFTVSRDDGQYLGLVGEVTERDVDINARVGCQTSNGRPASVAATVFVAADRDIGQGNSVLFVIQIPDIGLGNWSVYVSRDILYAYGHLGAEGVWDGEGQFTVTNFSPDNPTMQISLLSASTDALVVRGYGTFSDECPAHCTTVVSGSLWARDSQGSTTGGGISLGSQTSTGSPYQQTWTVGSGAFGQLGRPTHTAEVGVLLSSVTTDPYGQTSWTQHTWLWIPVSDVNGWQRD